MTQTFDYIPRVVDRELDELTTALPAISLEGARGVGKTATATRYARTVFALDDPAILEVVSGDPHVLTTGDPPILIDEWQRLQSSWDLVRRAVDSDPTAAGRFLLTGSVSPLRPTTHSGAGRIVGIRMRPMALAERDLGRATVSLTELMKGERPPITGQTSVTLAHYAAEICASGFPGIRVLPPRARELQLDSYLTRIVDRDVEEAGSTVRNVALLRRWMAAYAAATSTVASYETIRDAATPGESEKPAKKTVMAYRHVLEHLWLLDPIPAWLPTRNRISRLTAGPKHHLVDPAIAARLLDAHADALLAARPAASRMWREATLLGQLFESLVTLSVRVYAQAAQATLGHLRTEAGEHEVDLIVEARDGRVLAIEVKLAQVPGDKDLKHLRWLKQTIGDDLLDAVVVTTGPRAYRREDGIAVIPAALLGP